MKFGIFRKIHMFVILYGLDCEIKIFKFGKIVKTSNSFEDFCC